MNSARWVSIARCAQLKINASRLAHADDQSQRHGQSVASVVLPGFRLCRSLAYLGSPHPVLGALKGRLPQHMCEQPGLQRYNLLTQRNSLGIHVSICRSLACSHFLTRRTTDQLSKTDRSLMHARSANSRAFASKMFLAR